MAAERHRGHHRAGQPLGARRHQDRSSLLPNVLAKQAAREQGAREAWFVDQDGRVTEGASSNAWIVTASGKVVTRPADHGILRGHHPHGAARGHRGAGA